MAEADSKANSPDLYEDDDLTDFPVIAPFTWFGLDIGGSLTKLVYFEPNDIPNEDSETSEIKKTISIIHKYLSGNVAYGKTGIRDVNLECNVILGSYHGTLHFIRFPTSEMPAFLELAKAKNFPLLTTTLCATGGGAHKFSHEFKTMNMRLRKIDELKGLCRGIHYMDSINPTECFYYLNAKDDDLYSKEQFDFKTPYPYLCVNIGSGVSILSVTAPGKFNRVGGTSLGGGTFLGLCTVLTGCQSFEEALELAAAGNNAHCDKLVSDIYGGDYDKFGLAGDLVASSFGHMMHPDRLKTASKADLARSCLAMITYNISSLARLNARGLDIERVVFVGNFLRKNTISMRLLSHAMDYWSKGSMKALFLKHEGYFGAVGSLLELINPKCNSLRNSPTQLSTGSPTTDSKQSAETKNSPDIEHSTETEQSADTKNSAETSLN